MKKVVALLILVLAGAGILWRLYSLRRGAPQPALKLRAMMRDEDAPRPIEPSVYLQVNDSATATVFAGSPLWFSVAVDNAAALDEIAASRTLKERLAHISASDPRRPQLEADFQRRAAPPAIALGDATHPWAAAIQLALREAQGDQPLNWSLQPLGNPGGTVSLDASASVFADFGTASMAAPPGSYAIVACLGPTGSWKGRVCSQPVQLTVANRPDRLASDQELSLAEQSGRFALIAGDAQGLESAGRKLLAADQNSISGHLYLGEARYRQHQWRKALGEFTTARAEVRRSHPDAEEPPVFLNARISQCMARLLQ